jgi:hypothetical protein
MSSHPLDYIVRIADGEQIGAASEESIETDAIAVTRNHF